MESKVTNAVYHSPTPGEIPIIAASPFLNQTKSKLTVDQYSEILEEVVNCGFNVINLKPSYPFIPNMLKAASLHKLKVILGHSYIEEKKSNENPQLSEEEISNCTKFINDWKNNETIGGWLFKDEPKLSQISVNSKLYQLYSLIKSIDDRHLIYINLYGGASGVDIEVDIEKDEGDSQYQIERKKYNLYVDTFQNVFRPSYFCYDLYPFILNQKGELEPNFKTFYSDLDIFSDLSKKTGRPFWVFIQSMAFCNGYMKNFHPIATLPLLRFAVFSALGYGAQGIVYWTYHQRENTTEEEYLSAPVDINGKRTPIWNYVKQVNSEIKAFNDIFYNCQLIDCKHTVSFPKYIDGDLNDPIQDGTHLLDATTTFGPFSNIEASNKEVGIQISHLNTNGVDYIVIINQDIHNCQDVILKAPDYYKIFNLSLDDKFNRIEEIVSGTTQFNIKAGSYLIFKWY